MIANGSLVRFVQVKHKLTNLDLVVHEEPRSGEGKVVLSLDREDGIRYWVVDAATKKELMLRVPPDKIEAIA